MDSGNSGSLQSSSGADEECDSRAAVDSNPDFMTTHRHQPQPPPPPPFNHHHMFDQNQINNPLFFTTSPQHHQLLNLDSVIWSKTLPSFSDHHHHFSFPPSSSQPPTTMTTTTTAGEPMTSTAVNVPPRNPKKRSRASRRAPTTVLTTDTSNFRAMVQEFTGIPAPPFTSPSAAFPMNTSSFDLFGRSSSSAMMRSNHTTNNFDNLPQLPAANYLLRPFPQKVLLQPSISSSSSSLLDSSNLLNTMQMMQNSISFPSNSINNLQSSFLNNPNKTTQNVVSASNDYGVIGSAPMAIPTTTTTLNGKESSGVIADHQQSSGMKADQGFIEPWICSSD